MKHQNESTPRCGGCPPPYPDWSKGLKWGSIWGIVSGFMAFSFFHFTSRALSEGPSSLATGHGGFTLTGNLWLGLCVCFGSFVIFGVLAALRPPKSRREKS